MSVIVSIAISLPIGAFVAPLENAVAATSTTALLNTIPMIDPNVSALVSAGLIGDTLRFKATGFTVPVSVQFTGAPNAVTAKPVTGLADTFDVVVPAGTLSGLVTITDTAGHTLTSATNFQVWKTRSEPYVMPTGHLNITYNDLQYILDQIKMGEAHAMRTATLLGGLSVGTSSSTVKYPYDVTSINRCLTAADLAKAATSTFGATGLSGPYLWTADDPLGVRTVNGECNNISSVMAEPSSSATPKTADSAEWGSAEQTFTRLSPQANIPGSTLTLTDAQKLYQNPTGNVVDSSPRVISNLISDQSLNNPAAIAAAYEASATLYGQTSYATEIAINATTGDTSTILSIPNITPDYNVSAGYDSWFTLFGQFFDHGLDLVPKAGPAVVIPLNADDPLYSSSPNAPNMMVLTRASDSSGQSTNETTPWIDQSQTYGSHASQNFFLREYVTSVSGGKLTAKTNGRLLENNAGGLPTWADIKAQALRLGIKLTDYDAKSVPVIATDQYGKFIPGANGYPIMLFSNGSSYEWIEGIATGLPTEGVGVPSGFKAVGSGHAFINDTTASAVPFQGSFCSTPGGKLTADPDHIINSASAMPSCTYYDDETLDIHLVAGDGRVNENIGLSAVHNVFHSEHNLLVKDIQDMLAKDPIIPAAFKNEFTNATNGGERLYQAARFIMEMEYQHMAYDEFVRRIAPELPLFVTYDSSKNAAVTAEFASAVYRLGHSMLNETIARSNPGTFYDPAQNQDVALITAFTNPSQVRLVRPAYISSATFAGGIIKYYMNPNEAAPLVGEVVTISNMVNKGFNIQDAVVASSTATYFTISQNYKSGLVSPSDIVAPGVNGTNSKTSDCDTSVPANCTNYATVAISDPGNNGFSYTPGQATASIAQGMSSQRGNEIDEFVTDAVRNNLLGLPLDLATLNITRGRDVGLPTLNQFRALNSPKLAPYLSWNQFIESGLRHVESGANFIAAYGMHETILAETSTAGKRAAAIAITTAAQTVNITDAVSNGTSITYTGLNTYSVGQVVSVTGINLPSGSSCNVTQATVTAADVASFTVSSSNSCAGYKQATAKSPGSGGYADFDNNGNSLALAPPGDAVDFYNSTGKWNVSNSGLNNIDLWMGGLAEKPAKQPILAPMLGTTFQYVFTEQMQRLQDNDRFYYLSRLVGMNLFGEIPAQKFTDIVRRNTPSSSVGNSVTATGIIGMNNPGFGIADCAGSTTPGLVPGTMTCGGGKTDAVNLSLSHKGLDNVTLFADPLTLSHTTLIGGDGDDSIQGGAGNDSLSGGLGGDLIDGGAGNDVISGGPGEDILKGGAGNDVINTGSSQIGDIADGGSGSDFIHCGECSGVATSFIGEAGNDFIQGGKNNDLKLDGGEGDDWIEGGAGWDIIDGDNGPLLNILINLPVLFGGNDVITGGSGQDVMFGDGGDDIFNLGDGPGFPDGTFGFDWANYEYNLRFDNSPTLRPNVWADLSGALTNPNTARSNDTLINIEGLSGSSGNDKLFGGIGTADIVIPVSNRAMGKSGAITLTLPGVLNIAGGSVVTGTGIAPNAVVLALVGVVTGNTTTIQLSAPNTADVMGPIQISTAPLEVPSLISGLPELVLGTPGNAKYTAIDATSTKWSGGGIILGGDGNDTVYPSSGADVLHGSAYLHTCIGTTKSPTPQQFTAAADVVCGNGRGFSNMTLLAPLMDSGVLSPSDLQIVREILPTSASVTGLVSDGTTATYTAVNNFFVGEEVSIVGLSSTTAGSLTSYGTRNAVITAVTPTSFTVASTSGVLSQLNDITSGTAVGTDTLDLSGGATLAVGTPGTVAGGGISGPSSQFTFTAITGTLPAGASFGCRMTDSVSGAVLTLYDFERIKFTNGQVQNISANCGGSNAPSAPARPTAVAGPAALSATVSWVAPADNGTPIDYYIVEPTKAATGRGQGTVLTGFAGTCAGQVAANLLSCTVTGLTAGDVITFKITAHSPAGTSPKSQSSNSVTIAAATAKTVPTLAWIPSIAKTLGDAISTISPLPTKSPAGTPAGTFTYTATTGGAITITSLGSLTVSAVGSETVTALFTPTDLTRYETSTVSTRIVVSQPLVAPGSKITPSLTWTTSPLAKIVGDTFTLQVPAVAGGVLGTFSYTSDSTTVVSLSGTSASAVGVGTALITALFTPTDTATYTTSSVTLTVTVSATPGTPPPPVVGALQIQLTPSGVTSYPSGSVVRLAASGGSNSRVVFSTNTANCRIIGTDLTATSVTTCHVLASAGSVTSTVDVPFALATQTPLRISNKITSVKKNATVILTTIGGTSSGAVTYTITSSGSACVLNTDELTATAPTTCDVKATKSGTSMYAPIESPIVTFTFK